MIANRAWRSVAIGTVVGADLVVLFVSGAAVPGFVPFVVGALGVVTAWALAAPGGWGPFALLVVQVLGIGTTAEVPSTVAAWVLVAAAAAAVVLTHLALTLMGSWPRRADLPPETARRWAVQAAALVWVAIGAAAVGALATLTPVGWASWLAAAGLCLVAGLTWQVRAATRRG